MISGTCFTPLFFQKNHFLIQVFFIRTTDTNVLCFQKKNVFQFNVRFESFLDPRFLFIRQTLKCRVSKKHQQPIFYAYFQKIHLSKGCCCYDLVDLPQPFSRTFSLSIHLVALVNEQRNLPLNQPRHQKIQSKLIFSEIQISFTTTSFMLFTKPAAQQSTGEMNQSIDCP